MSHVLNIPDALVTWGKTQDVAWLRPFAHELERMLADASNGVMGEDQTERMLNRVEALSVEATRAGRGDLLLELDMKTAETLNVVYTFERGEHRVPLSFGTGQRFDYDELRVVLSSSDPAGAASVAETVKDFLATSFPQARIDAIVEPREVACDSCGEESLVMVETVHGGEYCGSCWSSMTDLTPMADLAKRGRK